MEPKPEQWKPNIRFRAADLKLMIRAAALEQMNTSSWIRELALARAELTLSGEAGSLTPLVYDTAHGFGKPISIRFSHAEYKRILTAANRDKMLPSVWVRAVAVQRVRGEKDAADQRGGGAAQRKRVKDGPAAQVPVVGKSQRQAPARP